LKSFSGVRLNNEQFPALTGIRAVAAFMVFFHHLPLHLQPGFLIGWQLSFYTGVTIFFVLSGFLITYRYYGKIELSSRYAWNYFINRFARIYPLYFLVLTVVIFSNRNFDPVFLLQNYTLTHNLPFIFQSHGMAIDPSWSLTVEECFYLLAPLLFFLCKKTGIWLPFTIVILILLLLVNKSHTLKLDLKIMFSSFFGNSVAFFSGIFLALYLLKKRKVNKFYGAKYRTVAGLLGIAILFIPLIYVTNKNNSLRNLFMIIFNNLLMPIPIALLFYGLIKENSLVKKILSTYVVRLFGRSSYAFYLIHLPVIDLLARPYLKSYFNDTYYNWFVLVTFVVVLILSIALYLFFEEPANRMLRNKYGTRVFSSKHSEMKGFPVG
jgi:peptidoglycan/LPS O-acetylase OafA/YrhL